MGFEPTISKLERVKTIQVLDSATTVIAVKEIRVARLLVYVPENMFRGQVYVMIACLPTKSVLGTGGRHFVSVD
jgi:hypothetical protein